MKKKDEELGEIVVVIVCNDDDKSRDYRKRKVLRRSGGCRMWKKCGAAT